MVAKRREIEAASKALEARASAIHASLPQRCGPEACMRQRARCFWDGAHSKRLLAMR